MHRRAENGQGSSERTGRLGSHHGHAFALRLLALAHHRRTGRGRHHAGGRRGLCRGGILVARGPPGRGRETDGPGPGGRIRRPGARTRASPLQCPQPRERIRRSLMGRRGLRGRAAAGVRELPRPAPLPRRRPRRHPGSPDPGQRRGRRGACPALRRDHRWPRRARAGHLRGPPHRAAPLHRRDPARWLRGPGPRRADRGHGLLALCRGPAAEPRRHQDQLDFLGTPADALGRHAAARGGDAGPGGSQRHRAGRFHDRVGAATRMAR